MVNFSENKGVSTEEIIQALELLGASIVSKDGNLYQAANCWEKALNMR